MRRNRIILLVLWILSLVGISVSGGEITYSFFFLLTLIPIASLLYIFCVYLLFKIYQVLSGRDIVCNHPTALYFTLQNESLLLFSGIRVTFYSSFSTITGLSDYTEYEFRPHSGIKKETTIVCRYRGEYEVGIKRIIIQDFFRLFSISCRNKEPFKVTVKPDIVHLSELKATDLVLAAVRDSRLFRSEPDYVMREYVPGDDPRLINWKASGASGKLMLRERIGEQQQGVGILLEPQRFSQRIEDYLPLENKLLETVIALNSYLSEQGIPSETFYLKSALESCVVENQKGFEELYNRMSSYVFQTDHSAPLLYEETLRSGKLFQKKAVFLVIHRWDDAARTFAAELSRNNTAVTICVVTDEELDATLQLPRTNLLRIPTDADLTEVL